MQNANVFNQSEKRRKTFTVLTEEIYAKQAKQVDVDDADFGRKRNALSADWLRSGRSRRRQRRTKASRRVEVASQRAMDRALKLARSRTR